MGQGLWRIKDRSFVCQHQLHPGELELFGHDLADDRRNKQDLIRSGIRSFVPKHMRCLNYCVRDLKVIPDSHETGFHVCNWLISHIHSDKRNVRQQMVMASGFSVRY